MLTSAREHYRRQRLIAVRGLRAARTARKDGARAVARVVVAHQLLAATDAAQSVDLMLAEQNIDDPLDGTVNVALLAGAASDGRPLDTLFTQAGDNDALFAMMVLTQLQDVARAAASVSIAGRGSVGYVRMLNPPSCSRCAVQAGRYFRWNTGFERHPRCDCRHIPASEATAGDLTTNPQAYFDSLSEAEQNRIFTNAGAQAIREGADVGRVVNARRGMTTAQQNLRGWIPKGRLVRTDVFGRPVFTTTESVTKRGAARKAMGPRRPVRLMPESIFEIADGDRAEARRLLKLYGYIT